jgi:hypothetical protein
VQDKLIQMFMGLHPILAFAVKLGIPLAATITALLMYKFVYRYARMMWRTVEDHFTYTITILGSHALNKKISQYVVEYAPRSQARSLALLPPKAARQITCCRTARYSFSCHSFNRRPIYCYHASSTSRHG